MSLSYCSIILLYSLVTVASLSTCKINLRLGCITFFKHNYSVSGLSGGRSGRCLHGITIFSVFKQILRCYFCCFHYYYLRLVKLFIRWKERGECAISTRYSSCIKRKLSSFRTQKQLCLSNWADC